MVVRFTFRRRKACRYRRGWLVVDVWFRTMIWLLRSSMALMMSLLGPDEVRVITRDGANSGLLDGFPPAWLIRIRSCWTVLPCRRTRRRMGQRQLAQQVPLCRTRHRKKRFVLV